MFDLPDSSESSPLCCKVNTSDPGEEGEVRKINTTHPLPMPVQHTVPGSTAIQYRPIRLRLLRLDPRPIVPGPGLLAFLTDT